MRRDGQLEWSFITDGTRWQRKPSTCIRECCATSAVIWAARLMAAPAHMLSMAAEFALILGEIHPEHAWVVEVAVSGVPDTPKPGGCETRELPWPDSTTEGGS
jgi:hypothetical protein